MSGIRILCQKLPDTCEFVEVWAKVDTDGHVLPQFKYQTQSLFGIIRHGSLSDAIEAAMYGLDELSILDQVAVCSALAVATYLQQQNNLSNLPPFPQQ